VNPKAEELRNLADGELLARLDEAHRELFTLRFQHVTRQLANYQRLGEVRRDIARIKTLLRQRGIKR
jgi:large subunit ribosomal protein L29